MKNKQSKKPKLPIILYEEPKPGEAANPIPYIEIGKDDDMHDILFISEYKETGEFEVDAETGQAPIVDMLIHAYVRLEKLKKVLDPKLFDQVRVALGMQPLKKASKAGQKVLNRVTANAEENKNALEHDEEKRAARAFSLGEDLRKKADRYLEEKAKEEEN